MDADFSPEHKKFIEDNPDVLTEGYTTTTEHLDGERAQWICDACFHDFSARFAWRVSEA